MVEKAPISLGELADSDIPRGWAATSLTSVASIASGQVDPREAPYRSWPLIAPNHIETETGQLLAEIATAEEQGAISGKYQVRPGDVVYSKIRPHLRKAWLADRDALCSADMYPLRVSGSADARYLLAIILSSDFSRYAERMSARTGIPKINRAGLSSYHVPLPPLAEQRKIAAILSSVDDAIAATRKVLEQTKRVKQGLLQTLMTRGIGHTRFKKAEIGEIPEAWEIKAVENCCEILDRHRVPLNSDERRDRQGQIPYWGANGIVDYIDDFIFDEPLVLIAEDGGYFAEAAERPIANLVDSKVWVNNHAHVLRVVDHVSREWFYFWFVHRDITPFINSGTRSKLNQQDLRKLPVAVPPPDEQRRVVGGLESVRQSIGVHELALSRLSLLKRGLMQDLLTGRVRVQPD